MINIAEILKRKQYKTKLWTPIFGTVSLYKIHGLHEESIIEVCTACSGTWSFTKDGKIKSRDEAQAEMTLFPSKKMKDWSKFAWKEGDILENTSDSVLPRYLTFKGYVDDEYTTFEATKGITTSGKLTTYSIQDTLSYTKIEDEERVHTVKEKIDKLLREIEAANSPDHTLQPFDKVLVRDYKDEVWRPSFYGRKYDNRSFSYVTALGIFKYCIPYNEKTKHLLGTTEPYYKED
jgi:hypothetical protein